MEKNIIFFCFAAMMMLTIGRVSAETISDDTNDVLHAEWKTGLQEYSYKQATSDKPNVDITKIAYEISGQQLSLLMAVKGNIQDASNAVYSLFYNTTSATYQIYYTGGTGYCFGSALDGTEYTQGNATVQGNTLSTSMRLIGNGTTVKFWALAATGENIGQTGGEWWGDWVPEDFAPNIDNDNNEGDGNDGSTPGFEFMLIASALAVMAFMHKRKRQ